MRGLSALVKFGQCLRDLLHSADDIPQCGHQIAELVVEINDVGMLHGVLLLFEAASGVPQFRTPAMNRLVEESLQATRNEGQVTPVRER